MNWKSLYKLLTTFRKLLDALIARVRARAFPESQGRRKRKPAEPPTVLPAEERVQ